MKRSKGWRLLSIVLTIVMLVTLIPNVGVKEVKADTSISEIDISSDKFELVEGDSLNNNGQIFWNVTYTDTRLQSCSFSVDYDYDKVSGVTKGATYEAGETFIAGHRYELLLIVYPRSGYSFGEELKVNATFKGKNYTFYMTKYSSANGFISYTCDYIMPSSKISDAVTVKYSGGNITIKEGENVPIAPEKYSIDSGTIYTFSSLTWYNASNTPGYSYSNGDKFQKGTLKLYLNLTTEKNTTVPSSINVTFNGEISEWSKSASEPSAGTCSYVKTINVPGSADKLISDAAVAIIDYDDDEEEFYYYKGSAIEPQLEVKYSGTPLIEGTDYEVSYANNVNFGESAQINIAGKGSYSGTKQILFKITKQYISNVTVASIPNQIYTGNEIKPIPTLTYNGKTLVLGTDYSLNYSDNIDVGTAKVSIIGKGNFRSTRSDVTFKIVKSGSDPDIHEKTEFEKFVENATEVEDANYLTYVKGEATVYKTTLATASKLKFAYTSTSAYNIDGFEIRIYDKAGNEIKTLTQKNVAKELRVYDYVTDVLAAGDYYISIVGTSTVDNINGVKLSVIPDSQSTDPSGAQTVELPYIDKTIELNWYQATVDGSHIKQYFNLVVADKAYYTIIGSKLSGGLSLKDASGNEVIQSTLIRRDEEMVLDKGTYLLEVYSRNDGDNTLSIKCRDFIDIKSISGTDYYEMYNGATLPISVAFEPATFESSFKWTSENEDAASFTNYDYNQKMTLEDPTKAFIYAKKLGLYSGTITTSEGVSKTIKVMVKPAPVKVNEATAYTKSKKKASLNLKWEATGNYFKIYEKSGNDYKLLTETSNNSITLNKAPGKTYNIMIESCYKVGNDIVCSSKGDGVNVITAPYSAPKIKSAKQKGKTKYTKPYTKSYKHWNGRYYYWDTVKGGNCSTAVIKLGIKKAKGAKWYETGKGYKLTGNTTIYSYTGKIKGATETLKIRGVWENAVTKAYGPWSKTKKIKIKGNK